LATRVLKIEGPDGTVYKVEGPADAPDQDFVTYLQSEISAGRGAAMAISAPTSAPAEADDSDTNIFRDVPGSLIAGVGQLAQLPGQLYGLATGDFDNLSTQAGGWIEQKGDAIKSPGLRAMEKNAAARIDRAGEQGMLAEAATAAGEYLGSPRLLISGIAQAAPSLAGTLGAGFVAKKGVQRLAANASAKTANRVGLGAAVGAGAAQNAGAVGAETYTRVMDLPDEVIAKSPDYQALIAEGVDPATARETLATSAAREASATAATTTVATSLLLPGAEKFTFGSRLGGSRLGAALRGGLGEGLQETLEEGGGKLSENVAVSDIDPSVEITRGVAGQGVIGGLIGFGLGAGTGSTIGYDPSTPTPAPAATPPAATPPAAAAAARATGLSGPAAAPAPEPVTTGLGERGNVIAVRETDRKGNTRLVNYGYEGEQDGFVMLRNERGDIVPTDPAELEGRIMRPVDPPKGALAVPFDSGFGLDPDDPGIGGGGSAPRNSFMADAEADALADPVPPLAPTPLGLGGTDRTMRPLTASQTEIDEQTRRVERLKANAIQARTIFNAGLPNAVDEEQIEAMESIALDEQTKLDDMIARQRASQTKALGSAPNPVNLGALDQGAKRVPTGDLPAGSRGLSPTPLDRAAERVPTGDVPSGSRPLGQAGMTPLEIAMQGRPAGEPQAPELRPLGVPPTDVTVQRPAQAAPKQPKPAKAPAPEMPKLALGDWRKKGKTFTYDIVDETGQAVAQTTGRNVETARKKANAFIRQQRRVARGLPETRTVTRRKAKDILEFVAQAGGVAPDADIAQIFDGKAPFIPQAGNVVRSTGRPADMAREAAVEAGWLPEGSTVADFYEALRDANMRRGTKDAGASNVTGPTPDSIPDRDEFEARFGAPEDVYRRLQNEIRSLDIEPTTGATYDELMVELIDRLNVLGAADVDEAIELLNEIDRIIGPDLAAIVAEQAQDGDFDDRFNDPGYLAELAAAIGEGNPPSESDEGDTDGPTPDARTEEASGGGDRRAGRMEQAGGQAGGVGNTATGSLNLFNDGQTGKTPEQQRQEAEIKARLQQSGMRGGNAGLDTQDGGLFNNGTGKQGDIEDAAGVPDVSGPKPPASGTMDLSKIEDDTLASFMRDFVEKAGDFTEKSGSFPITDRLGVFYELTADEFRAAGVVDENETLPGDLRLTNEGVWALVSEAEKRGIIDNNGRIVPASQRKPQTTLPVDAKQPEKAATSVEAKRREIDDQIVRFASGMSSIGDLTSGSYALSDDPRAGIGVEAGNLSGPAINRLAHAILRWRARAFVDSGAFSLFRKNIREAEAYQRAATDLFSDGNEPAPEWNRLDFDEVLGVYEEITDLIGDANAEETTDYPRPMFVMPDVVGDQAASIELARRYKNEIATDAAFNVSQPIVPIQKGELSLREAYQAIIDILGTDNFIVGIPSNEQAVSTAELREFFEAGVPKRIHFLGAVSEEKLGPKLDALAEALARDGATLDHLSADANVLRSALYGKPEFKDTPRGEAINTVLKDKVASTSPRNLNDQARRILGVMGFTADEIGAMTADEINTALDTANLYAREVKVSEGKAEGDAGFYVSVGETNAMHTLWSFKRWTNASGSYIVPTYIRNLSTNRDDALKLAKIAAGKGGFDTVYSITEKELRQIERAPSKKTETPPPPAIPDGVTLPEGLLPGTTATTATAEPTNDPAPAPVKPLSEMTDDELLAHFGLTIREGTSRNGSPYWSFGGDLQRGQDALDRAGATAPSTYNGRTTRAVFRKSAYDEVIKALRGDIPVEGTEPSMTAEQAAKALKANGLTVMEVKGTWYVEGKTYDNRFELKKAGGSFVKKGSGRNKLAAYTYTSDPTLRIAEALAAEGKVSGPEENAGDGPGTGGSLARPPHIDALRQREDAAPDSRPNGADAVGLVSDTTKGLIERGLKFNIPQEVVDDQIDDIGRITWAFKNARPMFMLANAAGTGKTYVLGGAIREMRAQGATKFIYATMNQDLIAQIKRDLAAFGIDDVEFVTYSKLSDGKTDLDTSGAVLIFDEAHNIKNLVDGSARALRAKDMIAAARFTVFASATPYENPVQAQYLTSTGVFEDVGGFDEWAWAYGAERRQKTIPHPYRRGEKLTIEYMAWPKTASKEDGKAARAWLDKRGMLTQRAMKIDPEMVDVAFRRAAVDPAYQELYDKVVQAYNLAMGEDENADVDAAVGSTIKRHREGMLKRILEAAKAPAAIEMAKQELASGRAKSIVIFVETKAERWVGRFRTTEAYDKKDQKLYEYPDIKSMMDQWRDARAMAKVMGDGDVGPPPFSPDVEMVAKAMYELGIDYQLPSVPEMIAAAFPKGQVREYTGNLTGTAATKNKEAFLKREFPVIVATMAKGGTGLSLHDTVGDSETTQININLPWTASSVDQVSARVARYGLRSKARILWMFASNIPWETRVLAPKVGKKMADMGAVVAGLDIKAANVLLDDFDFEGDVDVKQLQGTSEDAVDVVAEDEVTETDTSAAGPLTVTDNGRTRQSDGTLQHWATLSDGTRVVFYRDTDQFSTPVWNIDLDSIGVSNRDMGGWDKPQTSIGFTREEAIDNLPGKVEQVREHVAKKRQAKLDEARLDVEDQAVHDNLTANEKKTLADAYGQRSYNETAKGRFVDAVVSVANGVTAGISERVVAIAKRIMSAVLAFAIVFNAAGLGPATSLPHAEAYSGTRTVAVRGSVTEEMKRVMSPAAQEVYARVAPVETNADQRFIIVDKNDGRTHLFDSDGNRLATTYTLTGKTQGDEVSERRASLTETLTQDGALKGFSDADKLTPAGRFTAKLGSTTNTPWNVALRLYDGEGKTTGVAIHANGATAENRLGRLASATGADNRITYGCITTTKEFFAAMLRKDGSEIVSEWDGATVFVMPDTKSIDEVVEQRSKTVSNKTALYADNGDQQQGRDERKSGDSEAKRRGAASAKRRRAPSSRDLKRMAEDAAKADLDYYNDFAAGMERNRGCN